MEKNRFGVQESTALKGVAIIMMMVHHCFRLPEFFENYSVSFYPFSQDFVVDVSAMFKICVSIFVFVTGYGLTLSLKKAFPNCEWNSSQIKKWSVDRIIKVLSGFWFVAVFAYVICELLNGKTSSAFFGDGFFYGIATLFSNFFGLSHLLGTENFDSSWWYMSVAVLYVISVPFFLKMFKKCSYLPVLTAVAVIPRILNTGYRSSSYISFLFMLLLGMIFAENNLVVKIADIKLCKNKYLSKLLKFVTGAGVLYIMFRFYNVLPGKEFWEIRYAVIPLFVILFLNEFIISIPVVKQILVFLGKHSMNIFLVHQFVRTDYLNSFVYSFKHFALISLVLLVISLLISIVTELLKLVLHYDEFIKKLGGKIVEKIS